MGLIKENYYTKNQKKISLVARAMAHPARVKMLELLPRYRKGHKSVELAKLLNLSNRSVKDHIDKLKDAKLISAKYFIHYHDIRINRKGKRALKYMGKI